MRFVAWVALGLLVLPPAAADAAVVKNKDTMTTALAYSAATGKDQWVVRVDPQDVNSFQLDVTFDAARVSLDTNYGTRGVEYKDPFSQMTTAAISSGDVQISGTTSTLDPGDVDLFELHFIDNNSGTTIIDVPFTISAAGTGDFLGSFDTSTNKETIVGGANIAPITLTSTPGVNPMIWDPDGAYNNGTTGGAGIWKTTSTQWDNLSPEVVVTDTNWSNSVNVHDIAVFGGSSGGTVTVGTQISTGGLQFDMPGYILQSGTLNLSAPVGSVPTINADGNDATISSVLSGSAFQKLGTGTLALSGNNTFSGTTTISGGAVQVSSDGNLGATTNALVLDSGTLETTSSMTLNSNRAITVDAGGGTLNTDSGTTLNYGGIMSGVGALIKAGLGTLVMSGSSPNFSGGTVIDNGELHLTGALASSVSVTTGTFSGTGTLNGPLTVGGGGSANGGPESFLKAGSFGTIGKLSVNSLFLNSGALFQVDLNSGTPNTFDQILLSGSSNLGSGVAALAVTDLGTSTIPLNTIFTIIDNTSTQPTTGFFAGLQNGSIFTAGANDFEINYDTGAASNDVQLRVVPEPGEWAMLFCGFGLIFYFRRWRR